MPINDPNDINEISAKSTDQIEEAPDPSAIAHPSGSDGGPDTSEGVVNDDSGRTYQDDLDSKFSDTDPFIDEATDDPTEELQVPVGEYKTEMDDIALDDLERGHEDMRERIEDRDEDDDNAASAPQ